MHQYEQLDVWHRGIALAAALHRAARRVNPTWSDRKLWEQITRAAASVPANVAEGANRGSQREFARFLAIAMGSAAELHSLIQLAAASSVLGADEARVFSGEAVALRRMAGALRDRANGLQQRSPRSASKT